MGMADELEKYVRANAGDGSVTAVARLLSGVDLLLFGETHVKLDIKARFFAALIRHARSSKLFQYFASEHFINDARSDGAAVDAFLKDARSGAKLPPHLRVQAPILDAVRDSLPAFGVVFAGTGASGQRDRRIHTHFKDSRALHLKARRFAAEAKGVFHLGADHAGRTPNEGADRTTCGHLVAGGFTVHVVRLMSAKVGGMRPDGVIEAGESADVRERSTRPDDIDNWIGLVPIVNRVAGGKPILVDLRSGRSPFKEVLDSGGSAVFADRFDSILHLPG